MFENMKLKRTPELHAFFTTYISDADPGLDQQTTRDFAATVPPAHLQQLAAQTKLLIADPELPIDELGSEANRWFGDAEETRVWLSQLLEILDQAPASEVLAVKDSNGTLLKEGDSVIVIKDLKVKGGTSDLKRGAMIKKIHLIDDAEAIECRVDGSTLVLKTCFLKKS